MSYNSTSFAKMVAEEHQGCLKKLSKFAPDASREGYLVGNQADQSRPRNDSTAKTTNDPSKKPNQNGVSNQNAVAGGSITTGIDMMQQMVAEGIQSTDKHMKAAEALMAKIDKAETSSSLPKND